MLIIEKRYHNVVKFLEVSETIESLLSIPDFQLILLNWRKTLKHCFTRFESNATTASCLTGHIMQFIQFILYNWGNIL